MNLLNLPFLVLTLFLFGCQTTPKTTPHKKTNSFTFDSNSPIYPSITNTWQCSKHQTKKEAREDVIKLEDDYLKHLKLGKSKKLNESKFSKLQSDYGCQVVGLKASGQKISLEAVSERGDTVRVSCPRDIPQGGGELAKSRAETALKYLLDQQEQMYRMVRSDYYEIEAFANETEATMLKDFACTQSYLARPIATRGITQNGNYD